MPSKKFEKFEKNEKTLRLLLFTAVAGLHILLIFFLAFNVKAASQQPQENARVMKVTDIAELPPPPLPPPPPPPPRTPAPRETQVTESIAETMIETDAPPPPIAAAPIIDTPSQVRPSEEYLPAHKVSQTPKFDEKELAAAVVYPEIAKRSGIEGRVILELFVDRNGLVQRISIVQETPPGRGFGEAAVKAFTGRRAAPAQANGEAVSIRYRYPVTFRLK
jgi:protein TonB